MYDTVQKVLLSVLAVTFASDMAKRIFIADDNLFVRRLMRTFIEAQSDLGVCGEATDGVEAVTKAQESKPDVIILDFSMPRMNGLEAAEILKAILPAVPKILFTLHKDAIPEELAHLAGISSVFSKADGMGGLIDEVRRLLGSALSPVIAD